MRWLCSMLAVLLLSQLAYAQCQGYDTRGYYGRPGIGFNLRLQVGGFDARPARGPYYSPPRISEFSYPTYPQLYGGCFERERFSTYNAGYYAPSFQQFPQYAPQAEYWPRPELAGPQGYCPWCR